MTIACDVNKPYWIDLDVNEGSRLELLTTRSVAALLDKNAIGGLFRGARVSPADRTVRRRKAAS